jgi:DnaJ-class molecular chaperone
MASSGRGSRSKGKAAELQVVQIAREHGFPNAQRDWATPQRNGDIKGISDSIHLEVRRREALSIEAWMKEIEGKAAKRQRCSKCDGYGPTWAEEGAHCNRCNSLGFEEGRIPVLAFRRSNQPWRVCLPLEDFLDLLSDRRKP